MLKRKRVNEVEQNKKNKWLYLLICSQIPAKVVLFDNSDITVTYDCNAE